MEIMKSKIFLWTGLVNVLVVCTIFQGLIRIGQPNSSPCLNVTDGGKIAIQDSLSNIYKGTFQLINLETPTGANIENGSIIYRWLKKEIRGKWIVIPNEDKEAYYTDSIANYRCFMRQAQTNCDSLRDDRWISSEQICIEIDRAIDNNSLDGQRQNRSRGEGRSSSVCGVFGGLIGACGSFLHGDNNTSPGRNSASDIIINGCSYDPPKICGEPMSGASRYQWEANYRIIGTGVDVDPGTITNNTCFRRWTVYICSSIEKYVLSSKTICYELNCYDCPNLGLNIGDSCNDNDSNTSNDKVQSNCTCRGTPNCTKSTWFYDEDGDGYGVTNQTVLSCTQPNDYVDNGRDLCPSDPNKHFEGNCGCGVAETNYKKWYYDWDADTYAQIIIFGLALLAVCTELPVAEMPVTMMPVKPLLVIAVAVWQKATTKNGIMMAIMTAVEPVVTEQLARQVEIIGLQKAEMPAIVMPVKPLLVIAVVV